MDRTRLCGSRNVGSIPTEGTTLRKIVPAHYFLVVPGGDMFLRHIGVKTIEPGSRALNI